MYYKDKKNEGWINYVTFDTRNRPSTVARSRLLLKKQ